MSEMLESNCIQLHQSPRLCKVLHQKCFKKYQVSFIPLSEEAMRSQGQLMCYDSLDMLNPEVD